MAAQTANVTEYHNSAYINYFSTSQKQKDQTYSNGQKEKSLTSNTPFGQNAGQSVPELIRFFHEIEQQKNVASFKHPEFVKSNASKNAVPCSGDSESSSEESEDESNYGYDTDDNSYPLKTLQAEIEDMMNSDKELTDAMESLRHKMENNTPKT